MKNYASVAVGFLFGATLASLFFVMQNSQIKRPVPEVAECKPQIIDSCAVSKEILPPPKFDEKLPEKLETNHEAEVRVAWTPVLGAKSYSVFVTNSAGRLVRRYTTTHNAIFLKDIPTPPDIDQIEYKVSLATVNANNEDGDKSESRALKVNKQASVVAPTVKKIVVED